MFNLSNSLSLLRAPLAFLILFENTTVRLLAIVLAMITDSVDGYLARRSKTTTRLGAILDPAMDKFFVLFALSVFLFEHRLSGWEALSMFSRDFALCIFGLYLSLSGAWQTYEFRSIRWGKMTTALQFIVLIGLALCKQFPWYLYCSFVLLAILVLIDLFYFKETASTPL